MKCPHCGNEIKEDHLICEVCGEEIRMVPDFEPEIENSITETMSTLVGLQKEEEAQNAENTDGMLQKTRRGKRDGFSGGKIWAAVSLAAVLAVAAVSYAMYTYHVGTTEYLLEKAEENAGKGDYAEAIACLESAYAKDDSLSEALFMEADYYYLQEDYDAAIAVLMRIIDSGRYSYENVEEAYNKAIAIYANQGRYEEINVLLKNCGEESIVSLFQGYMAMGPEFNYAEGDYEEVIPLKLSSNTSGTIYYTLDGTTPDERSEVYTAPLFLEAGEYVVSAVFVNDYGIKSDVVTKKYVINLSVPNAPEVELYSGAYSAPTMISVEGAQGCSVFYTTDESTPTRDSVPYTGPIPMPLGKTVFQFVNISEEGIASEVTTRTYTLSLEGAIPTSQAVSNLINRLVETGYLEDIAGHTDSRTGTLSYQFSSVIRVGSEGDYFTVYEYYDDGTGILNRTDAVFLVEVYTGETVARLGYDDNGSFMLLPI